MEVPSISIKNMIMIKRWFIACILFLFIAIHPCFALHKIAIEGMPGAGKTTIQLDLIAEFDQCILFPESHPEPGTKSEEYSESCEGDIYHQMQITRMQLIDQLPKEIATVLLDRSFYSNYAYQFALDQNRNTPEFAQYVRLFHQDFDNKKLDLIIFLDAKPETGLLRRGLRGDKIPKPWTEIKFLSELRNFYFHELPKLTNTPILYIATDQVPFHEVKAKVKQELLKWIPLLENTKVAKEEEKIIAFAKEYNLGIHHSQIVNVLGFPTMYFRDHGIVLFENRPIFFSNRGIKKMLLYQSHPL